MQVDFNSSIYQGVIQVIKNMIEAGDANGKLTFYTAPKPPPGDPITTQFSLVAFVYGDPCCSVSNRTAQFIVENSEVLATGEGDATWARATDSDGTFVIDLDVSDEAGDGAIKIDSIHLFPGGTVRLSSHSMTLI